MRLLGAIAVCTGAPLVALGVGAPAAWADRSATGADNASATGVDSSEVGQSQGQVGAGPKFIPPGFKGKCSKGDACAINNSAVGGTVKRTNKAGGTAIAYPGGLVPTHNVAIAGSTSYARAGSVNSFGVPNGGNNNYAEARGGGTAIATGGTFAVTNIGQSSAFAMGKNASATNTIPGTYSWATGKCSVTNGICHGK